MDSNIIQVILGGLANVAVVLLIAPFFQGVLRKVTARIQSRQGPPIWQPYFDTYLSLASILAIACLVPMGFKAPMSGAGDAILVIYLLTLSGICMLLMGLAAGSSYSLVGISREMMTMLTLEPLIAISIVIAAVHTQTFRLDTILNGGIYQTAGVPVSGIIMLGVMLVGCCPN